MVGMPKRTAWFGVLDGYMKRNLGFEYRIDLGEDNIIQEPLIYITGDPSLGDLRYVNINCGGGMKMFVAYLYDIEEDANLRMVPENEIMAIDRKMTEKIRNRYYGSPRFFENGELFGVGIEPYM